MNEGLTHKEISLLFGLLTKSNKDQLKKIEETINSEIILRNVREELKEV